MNTFKPKITNKETEKDTKNNQRPHPQLPAHEGKGGRKRIAFGVLMRVNVLKCTILR